MNEGEVEVRCVSFHSLIHLLYPVTGVAKVASVITYANQVFIHAINLLQPIISISC